MQAVWIRRTISIAAVLVLIGVAFAVQDAYAAPKKEKEKDAPKTVTLNMIIRSEADAEATAIVVKTSKKKPTPLTRTVSLKKGFNYFTYNKGKKGRYRVSLEAYGDVTSQEVTAVQGTYTVFFNVAPPKDGDSKKKASPVYQDLTKIKQKK